MTLDEDAAPAPKAFPQQARALRTRAKLIEAGRSAFARSGLDGANLADDILQPAGVSVGSFYHQFADKTELLLAVIDDGVHARRSLVVDEGLATAHESLEAMIAAGMKRFFESLDDERHSWRIQMAEQNNPDPRVHALVLAGRKQWVRQLAEALSRWSDAESSAILDAATLLMTLSTGIANVYLGSSDDDRRSQRQVMLEATTRFAIAGLEPIIGESGDRRTRQ